MTHHTARLAVLTALCAACFTSPMSAGQPPLPGLHETIDRRAADVVPKVIAWRRDFHQHPELGNREFRTSKIVAEHLRALGMEVRTNVAHTGVVGVLRGGKPGHVVALRSDMDALPVTEENDVPFKSAVRTQYEGREVGVMHACGHDAHMSILMGTAEVLAGMKADIPGTVVFIFQPAEEGAPTGEDGGAEMMIKEGVLDQPKVEAVFGLHVGIIPQEAGSIVFRPGSLMAASDVLKITVHGRQTHGALPWSGADPIVVASQIVLNLQTIVSRQSDLTIGPAVITIGSLHAGNRRNIIPDEATLEGTIRTFDPGMQKQIHAAIERTATHTAQAAGLTAETQIVVGDPVVYNDPALTERMTPTLKRVAAARFDPAVRVSTTAEDFSEYGRKVPSLFFFLGVAPKGSDLAKAEPNHSPRFFVDESALVTGVRALSSLAVDYLATAR